MIRNVEIGWRQGETEGAIRVEVVYSRRRTLGLEVRADGRVIQGAFQSGCDGFREGAAGMDCAKVV